MVKDFFACKTLHCYQSLIVILLCIDSTRLTDSQLSYLLGFLLLIALLEYLSNIHGKWMISEVEMLHGVISLGTHTAAIEAL